MLSVLILLTGCTVVYPFFFVQFVTSLKDNLNAEVVLGTVTNVKEASTWLGYTYLFVRMLKNPLVYGMTWEEVRIYTSDNVCNPIRVLILRFCVNVYCRLLLLIWNFHSEDLIVSN